MTKKTALITGITGMVGSHLADYLLEKTDWDVVGMCRWRSPLDNIAQHIPRINAKDRIRLLYGDLRDYHSIHDVVTEQQAGLRLPPRGAELSENLVRSRRSIRWKPTFRAPANLLEAFRKNDLKTPSSMFAPPPKCSAACRARSCRWTECTFHPASPYAISKVGTDLVGRSYAEAYGMTVMTTRMFTHTGPRRGDVSRVDFRQANRDDRGRFDPAHEAGNLDSLRTFADARDAVEASTCW